MKKLFLIPLILGVFAALIIAWIFLQTKPVSGDKNAQDFVITKGSSATQVAQKLEDSGLVRNAFIFKFYVQLTGTASRIQAGEYRLSPSYSLQEIVAQFLKGPLEIWVTIPEGLRREEIALRFASGLERGDDFVTEFLEASKGLEGKLFPDTYLFPKDVAAEKVVNRMVQTYNARVAGLTSVTGLNAEQLLVMASLLERETVTDEERPIVAGIMLKRMNAGWPLQIDAAVQYGVASARFRNADPNEVENWWPILTRDDIAMNTPYNTYKNGGLPPGPIASPGAASLKAAYAPAESIYWYYIHDPKGVIHYAETLEQHNENISKYLGK